jgi:hypothetical protein
VQPFLDLNLTVKAISIYADAMDGGSDWQQFLQQAADEILLIQKMKHLNVFKRQVDKGRMLEVLSL